LTGEKSQMSYQAVNEIIIRTTKLESVGEIIDLAVGAGANNYNYVNFEPEDQQELLIATSSFHPPFYDSGTCSHYFPFTSR
jgi:uncharacterized protein YggE